MADNTTLPGTGEIVEAKDIGSLVKRQVVSLGYRSTSLVDPLLAGGVTVESRYFSAAFSTLTRPANVTAYAIGNSISDNATAGSVTALVATVANAIDDPVCITELLLDTNDTGLAAAVQVRAFLFNSDPTASTGVVGGNGAAYSNKRAGFIGSMSGTFRAFSDGGKARLMPDEGSYIVTKPSSGGTSIWVQYQALSAFTPSAVSTTIIGTARGFQGRA